MKIPFFDLQKQYHNLQPELRVKIDEVFTQGWFIGGEAVETFEKQWAQYLGIEHVISCGNGTDGLEIILKALEIGQGDEVLVPAVSWVSTASAVGMVGAKPVFVDVEPQHFTVNPALLENKITSRTKAIIPVHLYGHPADMPAILDIARRYSLFVIEDSAQAHGAAIGNKKAGCWGDGAVFSFYPTKNLGAYGDGGCMVTSGSELAERLRRLANYGQLSRHDHLIEGRNSRLDTLQAALLQVKLPYLDHWNEQRIAQAMRYQRGLAETGVVLPCIRENYRHVFYLYPVISAQRDALQSWLGLQGIQTLIHYPTALPFLRCYQHFGHTTADFPVAVYHQQHTLSLPLYPELEDEKVDFIIEAIRNFAW